MSLRDCELDVATLLQAAGLGSLADGTPSLFAGPYPASAPDALISCRRTEAERPEKYLANTGLRLHRERVRVLVRGGRGPDAYQESGDRARMAWAALYELYPPEYTQLDAEEGGPSYEGLDEEGRPLWSFAVALEYLSATAPGVVVPLSRDASLRVGGLDVTSDARMGGTLMLRALPFAEFPSPVGAGGALLFDTDSGLLRVSDGSTWHAVGAPVLPPTAGEVAVTPAGNLSADTVQAALEELQADVDGRSAVGEVQALAGLVALKADADELAALQATVAGKASSTDVDALFFAVAGKASQAAFDSLSNAVGAHTGASAAHGVTGAVVGTTDVQVLRNKKHGGAFQIVEVDAGTDALSLPTASRLRFGTHPSAYLVASSPYDETIETPGTLKARVLQLQQGYVSGVGTQVTIAAGNLLGPAVRLRSGLKVSAPAAGRPASDGYVLLVDNSDGAGGYVEIFAVRHDGTTVQPTVDSTAAPGDATANVPRGFATVPAGASSVTITSTCARSGSQVQAWVQQASEDTAHPQLRTSVAGTGGAFTISCNPAPAAPLRVGWRID